jgi:hypothetical protein
MGHPRRVLLDKEKDFCQHYLTNGNIGYKAAEAAGFSKAYAPHAAARMLRNPHVLDYITRLSKNSVIEFEKHDDHLGGKAKVSLAPRGKMITREWKLRKLKLIVDLCVPDLAARKEEINASGGLNAIAEINKMQGEYPAEKKQVMNLNMDADIGTITKMVNELIDKNQKEY